MDLHKEKLERILNWFNGKVSFPFKIVLIPTNRCNLRCPYCPNALPRWNGKFKAEEELSNEEWIRVVNEGLKLRVKEWSIIGGGEPLLRKNAVTSMVELIKKHKDTDCEIITNGTLFGKKNIEKLFELKIDRVLFSLEGPDAEIHDSLRGVKNAFKRATKAIKTFAKLKKKFNQDKPYLKVNTVLNKRNFKKIEKMVKFVKRIGGQELALHPMREYYSLNEVKSLALKKDEITSLEEEIKKAKVISECLNFVLNTDMVEMKVKKSRKKKRYKSEILRKTERCSCFEPLYSMLIDPKGFVGGCAPAGRGIKNLNVKERSLKDIWFSEELSTLREKVLEGKSFDYCKKCGLIDMRVHLKNDLVRYAEDEVQKYTSNK